MKTGDKKQAVILTVVAVLAVGFLGYRLIPAGSKAVTALRSGEPGVKGASRELQLPLVVTGNPFSHPKLATLPIAATQSPLPNAPIDKSGTFPFQPGRPPGASDGSGSGQGPGASDGSGSGQGPGASDGSDSGHGPDESAGVIRRLKEQVPRISVIAIMRVERPLAMLSINNTNSRAFYEGDLVAPGVRLVKVGDNVVVVKVNGKLRSIAVGSEIGGEEDSK